MIRNHIAACLMATALVAAPAVAQTTMQPATPPAAGDTTQPLQTQPGMTEPNTTAPSTTEPSTTMTRPGTTQDAPVPATDTAQQPTGTMQTDTTTTDLAVQDQPGQDLNLEGGFIALQSPNHSLATDLIGVDVVGADDASIGSVNDLVMDGENRLVGIVIGVGGFLGIGEKNVAIPMDAANIVPEVDATAATGSGEATAREIEEIRVAMTKEQLDEAPEFARLERTAPAVEAPAAPGAAPGMAPAPGAEPAPRQPN